MGRWRTICISISRAFWKRRDRNTKSTLAVLCNHRYLWHVITHRDASSAKAFLRTVTVHVVFQQFNLPGLSRPSWLQRIASGLPSYSTTVQHFYFSNFSPALFLSSLTFLPFFFFTLILYLSVKVQSTTRREKEKYFQKTVPNILIVSCRCLRGVKPPLLS